MKLKSEFFEIAKDARDESGAKLEPEQQPALVVQNIEGGAAATTGAATGNAQQVGSIPLQVAHATTAGDLAAARARQCHNCRHFNRTAWNGLIRGAAEGVGDPADIETVNQVRAALLQTDNATLVDNFEAEDEGLDVERALHAMGICMPLTEVERATDPAFGPKELVVVFPAACCPPTSEKGYPIITPDKPNGLFVARDREAMRNAGADKDAVMLAAAGKEPK